jgi:hypothetical protein
MPTAQQGTERAQRARANGARSRGPKTAAGLHRARTASIKTGLYTTSVSGICPESNAAFLPFHARLLADWQPQTNEAELLVNQLITALWDAQILHNGYLIYMSELVDTLSATSPDADDPAKLIIEAQKLALNTGGGTVARFQARVSACNRIHHRIQRELFRLEKNRRTSAPSQKSLKTELQPNAANVQQQRPTNVAEMSHEKQRPTSAPSQKSLKTGAQPDTATIHQQKAPAANPQANAADIGHEKQHPTSGPSQKLLKTGTQQFIAPPRHQHPAHRK